MKLSRTKLRDLRQILDHFAHLARESAHKHAPAEGDPASPVHQYLIGKAEGLESARYELDLLL